MTGWRGHLCLHLDERGRPCNAPVMRLGMCSRHRPAPAPQKRDAASQRAAQVKFRAKRAKSQLTAGLAPAMEG
jgi:hypothetical protein